jgi:hypothetical protein
VFSPATVITLLAFGAVGAVMGWRRGTKALYRRSLSEPNLAPGETKRDHDRRLRRRRKAGRLVGTLLYCLVGMGVGVVFLATITTHR